MNTEMENCLSVSDWDALTDEEQNTVTLLNSKVSAAIADMSRTVAVFNQRIALRKQEASERAEYERLRKKYEGEGL